MTRRSSAHWYMRKLGLYQEATVLAVGWSHEVVHGWAAAGVAVSGIMIHRPYTHGMDSYMRSLLDKSPIQVKSEEHLLA